MIGQEARDDERDALASEIDRLMGWKHLRRYAGMTPEWMDRLRDAIVRAARKHPEPEITDEMVERAAYGMYRVRPLNLDQDGGDDWGILPESWRQEWRDAARAALTAALRVPVGEVEQAE